MSGTVDPVLVPGVRAWQRHNLLLTVTNNANGAVLSSSPFNWKDVLNSGV